MLADGLSINIFGHYNSFDIEFKKDIPLSGIIGCDLYSQHPQLRVFDKFRKACGDKFAALPTCIGHGTMHSKASIAAEIMSLWRGGLHKTKKWPSPMIGVKGWTRGEPSLRIVARYATLLCRRIFPNSAISGAWDSRVFQLIKGLYLLVMRFLDTWNLGCLFQFCLFKRRW